jgi:hypothetical protein
VEKSARTSESELMSRLGAQQIYRQQNRIKRRQNH